jgi:hypothetical protein
MYDPDYSSDDDAEGDEMAAPSYSIPTGSQPSYAFPNPTADDDTTSDEEELALEEEEEQEEPEIGQAGTPIPPPVLIRERYSFAPPLTDVQPPLSSLPPTHPPSLSEPRYIHPLAELPQGSDTLW